jgi:2-amino-4-hydroxy-6-hydroxymethyldihydropteridine diphosphokinase
MEIGFSLGSNLGDRLAVLQAARDQMLAVPETQRLAQSPVYETEPVGVKPEYAQLAFLNAVLVVESETPVETWLEEIGRIETALGRVRTEDRFAPRTLDVDIVYAGDRAIGSGGLEVPHPRWAQRRFVVQPLCDVRPDRVLPGFNRSVREVLAELPADEQVELFCREW